MLFGSHVSGAGGLENAPANSKLVGGEVFQFFSRSPRGGPTPPLTKEQISKFKQAMKDNGQQECYIHGPYFINLASTKTHIRYGSIKVIREELERGSLLGAKYVMFHPGSAKEVGKDQAIEMVVEGLVKILHGYKGGCELLLEISAGAGEVVGGNFEELAKILAGYQKKTKKTINICFDTQHAFASGYDLRDKVAVKKTFDLFDKTIGLEHLKMSHGNDSLIPLGARKDRHEEIGKGYIGLEGFAAIIKEKRLRKINFVLETPKDGPANDIRGLKILKKLRDG